MYKLLHIKRRSKQFLLASGELPDTSFLKDETHSNTFGTRKLYQNINNQCRVTKFSDPHKAPRNSRQHTLPAAGRGYKPHGYKPQINYCHICSMNNHSTGNCRFSGGNNGMKVVQYSRDSLGIRNTFPQMSFIVKIHLEYDESFSFDQTANVENVPYHNVPSTNHNSVTLCPDVTRRNSDHSTNDSSCPSSETRIDLNFMSKGLHFCNLSVRHLMPQIDELRIVMATDKCPDIVRYYLSPAESPSFGVQEKPLIFMLSKHFWRFTSLNLNTLIRHFIIQPFSCCKQLVSFVFSCV